MNKLLKVSSLLIVLTFLLGCSVDPEKKANKLYVTAASQLQNAAKEEKTLELLESTESKLQDLISKYPSSSIAVSLLSGQAKVGGLSLQELQVAIELIKKQKERLVELQTESIQLKASNAAINEDIKRLQTDPEYLEKVAREEHGMLKDDEMVFDFKKKIKEK